MENSTNLRYIEATPVCDTSIMAAGDIICAACAFPGAAVANDQNFYITGLDLFDLDDNTAIEMRIIGMAASTTLGTVNGPPSISDANGKKLLFDITVDAADWHDMGGFKFVRVSPAKLPLPCYPASGTNSIYITLLVGTAGTPTPTYTASGLFVRIWCQDMIQGSH